MLIDRCVISLNCFNSEFGFKADEFFGYKFFFALEFLLNPFYIFIADIIIVEKTE